MDWYDEMQALYEKDAKREAKETDELLEAEEMKDEN